MGYGYDRKGEKGGKGENEMDMSEEMEGARSMQEGGERARGGAVEEKFAKSIKEECRIRLLCASAEL